MSKKVERLQQFISKRGIIRSREIVEKGWSRAELARLEAKGEVSRIARGLYALSETVSETVIHGFAQASKRAPNGVICLLSALRFHNITTQMPYEIWLAIDNKARKPSLEYPPIHIVRFSGPALCKGIQTHLIEGVKIRVYSPAKTVADCFKYRNKIGTDVAIEALKECRSKKLATIDEIWHYAQICRVGNVIKPYLEVVG